MRINEVYLIEMIPLQTLRTFCHACLKQQTILRSVKLFRHASLEELYTPPARINTELTQFRFYLNQTPQEVR